MRDSAKPTREESTSAIDRFDADEVVDSGKLDTGADWVAVSEDRPKESCIYIHLVEGVDEDQIVDGGCFAQGLEGQTRVSRLSDSAYFVFGRIGSDAARAQPTDIEVSTSGADIASSTDHDGLFALLTKDEPEVITYDDAKGATHSLEIAE